MWPGCGPLCISITRPIINSVPTHSPTLEPQSTFDMGSILGIFAPTTSHSSLSSLVLLLLSSLVAHEYMKNKHVKAEEEQWWNSLRAPEWIGDYSTLFMLHFNKIQWKIIDLSILAKGPAVTPKVDTGQDTLNLTGVHLTFDRFTLIWNVEILASSHRP